MNCRQQSYLPGPCYCCWRQILQASGTGPGLAALSSFSPQHVLSHARCPWSQVTGIQHVRLAMRLMFSSGSLFVLCLSNASKPSHVQQNLFNTAAGSCNVCTAASIRLVVATEGMCNKYNILAAIRCLYPQRCMAQFTTVMACSTLTRMILASIKCHAIRSQAAPTFCSRSALIRKASFCG